MNDKLKHKYTYIILFAIAIMLILAYLSLFTTPKIIDLLTNEDMVFEYLTAIAFFLTSIIFLILFQRADKEENQVKYLWLKRLSYLGLALIFFIFAGEETSWGQRIFNTETPEIFSEHNRQNETNFHNLKFFKGGDGTIPINLEQLFVLFTFSIGLIAPAIASMNKRAKSFLNQFMPIFSWQLGLLIPLNYVLQKGFVRFFRKFPQLYGGSLDEPPTVPIYEIREYGYALVLLILALHFLLVISARKSMSVQMTSSEDE